MRIALLLLVLAVLAFSASASIIPAEYTEQKCGNGIREGYELCEPDTVFDLCPSIGKILKIAMVCNDATCNCLPDRSAKDCGNHILEGVEMCDPGTKEEFVDYCPNVSMAIGIPLMCDNKTCDCIPSGPRIVLSTCGDGKVEGNEDCESDDDCPKSRKCENCTCTRVEQDLNLTPVQHNVTEDELNVPTIEDITSRAGKTEIAGFLIEDYVGEVIPGELTKMVVQEVHPYGLNETSMEIWIGEDALNEIRNSDSRTATITRMLTDGTISYKPSGLFRRIWFWLFRPY